ncbi:hypothetical protein GCM10023187_34510 [Nibrella viscosa]|uniref:DUF2130 domain-containing protein n=1 Tax=Nibrella viscosa TaxID=1084524 RepID=A0ABP8KMH7_9BACT
MQQRLAQASARQNAHLQQQEADLKRRALALQQQVLNQQADVQRLVEAQLQQQKAALLARAQEEQQALVRALQEDLNAKSARIRDMQAQELRLLRQQRELEDQRAALDLEVEKRLQQERDAIRTTALQRAQDETKWELEQQQELIKSLTLQLSTMKQKLEQGSQQAQGEVVELALERLLTAVYPFDQIEEVAKGQHGADVIHTVRSEYGRVCGRIIYETKRTRTFSTGWIEKLKADLQLHRGDVAVLVTETMPRDMPQAGLYNGVWVCTFREVKLLSGVLRDGVLKVADARLAEENKGDKMQLLYRYLTSNEFRHGIESILRAFTVLRTELDKEKKRTYKAWTVREKTIDAVLANTTDLTGAIQCIAGIEVPDVSELEAEDDTLLLEG